MGLIDETHGPSLHDRLTHWLTSTVVLRTLFEELRLHRPILVVHDRVVVSRYSDVVEVLENSRDFGVTESYAAKMARATGPFILDMEDTPRYRAEAAFIRRAVRRDDLPRLRSIAAEEAQAILLAARPRARVDAAGSYARVIATRIVARFFGAPGPDEASMMGWLRAIFWDIFLNFGDDRAVTDAAAKASAGLNAYLTGLIAGRRRQLAAGAPLPDDFVGRLLAQAVAGDTTLDDDGIRRNVGGVIAGAVDTVSKAAVHALDQLLDRPEELRTARAAALSGDDDTLAAHVFEALRFNPHNPILIRTCHRSSLLAAGTSRETRIEPGQTVYVGTLSAMFDETVFETPAAFRLDRPPGQYLHFGRGQHTCFGDHINRVVVPEILKHLLRLPNLRRSEGDEGTLTYDGPFPSRLVLTFDV